MKLKIVLVLAGGLGLAACTPDAETPDYRQEMRNLVQGISARARQSRPGFIVIPQNGQQLVTSDGTAGGTIASAYLAAIDGLGREDLFYGYGNDDEPTPEAERSEMQAVLQLAQAQQKTVLVTDYCHTPAKMDDSYSRNAALGFVSFAADSRDLDRLPSYPAQPFGMNSDTIQQLGEARNFLYLINPGAFSSREEYLHAIAGSRYDVVIMDLFFNDGTAFTPQELATLKAKPGGGSRLLICYMSIGEAENYRYYWESWWTSRPPSFVVSENPSWTGNYRVKYWDENWQQIIFKGSRSYLSRIMDAGFDGIYLDIIDGFEFFEEI